MKKKTMFMIALGVLLSIGAMSCSASFKESAHVHSYDNHEKETMNLDDNKCSKDIVATNVTSDGKETVYFDITFETGVNETNKVIAFDTTLDDLSSVLTDNTYGNFSFYYNNELKQINALIETNGKFNFIYEDFCKPSAQVGDENNYYSHYKIKAGTIIFTTSTTNYVLQHDYNFWSTRGQNLGLSYIFQHGGNDGWGSNRTSDINSLEFTEFNGALIDIEKRFNFMPRYKETSSPFTYTSMGWEQRCPIYIDKGNGYTLSATTSKSPIIWADGALSNSNEQLFFIMQFSDLFDSSSSFSGISMDRSYYSYYIPDGTLWGGLDRPFMIQGDYYIEITKDEVNGSYIHGFYDSPHDYKRHAVKDATCSEDGNIEYYTCRDTHKGDHEYLIKNSDGSYTNTTLDKVVKPHTNVHKFVKVDEVAPSTGHHGTKAHYKCRECDKLFTDNSGTTTVTLNDLIIHDYVKHDAVSGTCEVDGNKEYYTCSACDKYFFKEGEAYTETTWNQIEIKAAHSYGELIPEVATTESKHGTKAHYQCSGCSKLFIKEGDNYVEVTTESLILHNLVEVKAKAATCNEDGNKTYKKCTCCNKLYVTDTSGNLVETTLAALTIPAIGHRFGSWKFDEVNLKITRSCQNCDQIETVDVNEENGFTYKVIVEPTTSSEGEATWTNEKYGTFTVTLPKLKETNSTGIIIGVAAGVSVVLIGGGVALYFVLKKKKN